MHAFISNTEHNSSCQGMFFGKITALFRISRHFLSENRSRFLLLKKILWLSSLCVEYQMLDPSILVAGSAALRMSAVYRPMESSLYVIT